MIQKVTGEETVSFPFFVAFNSLLKNMELVKRIHLQAADGDRDQELTKHEFLLAAQGMSQITPLQVDILYSLSDAIHDSPTMIFSDFDSIAPEQYYKKVYVALIAD